MISPSRRTYAVLVILLVGLAAIGIGYLITSEMSLNGKPDKLKTQFLFSDLKREENPDVQKGDLEELAEGNGEFALDLYQEVCGQDGNLFYSPYSISLALAMTYAGARGETEQQMADTLHFTLPQDSLHPAFNALDREILSRGEEENFTINIANAFWGQENYYFENEFLDRLALNYGAGIRLLDFASSPESSRATINEWVENETEDKIKDLLPPGSIDSLTRAVLTNAIYFNASWQHPFQESNTQDNTFTLLDDSQVTVPMMSQTESFRYAEGDSYQAIELPYYGEDMSMLVLLPERNYFDEFESSLNAERVGGIADNLKSESVELKMPKFEFEASMSLSKVLSNMGMPSAFSSSSADFSGITGDRSLFISEVLHKAFVSVDEKGTEAAAATAVVMPTSAITSPIEMSVDHPFIFMIRDDETGTILFLGRVLDPTA